MKRIVLAAIALSASACSFRQSAPINETRSWAVPAGSQVVESGELTSGATLEFDPSMNWDQYATWATQRAPAEYRLHRTAEGLMGARHVRGDQWMVTIKQRDNSSTQIVLTLVVSPD